MKTILCPVDLSSGSYLTSKYAALLAREWDARVALVALQPEPVPALVLASGQGEAYDRSEHQLAEMRDLLNSAYRVRCHILPEAVTPNNLTTIDQSAERFDLMVAGVPEAGTSYGKKYIDLMVKVIQRTQIPVLAVPYQFEYKKINRLLYAFDFRHEAEAPLEKLAGLAKVFGAQVRFLSIVPSAITSTEEEEINNIHNRLLNRWHYPSKVSFETIPYDDVPKCLAHYLAIWRSSDLLILSVNQEVKWSRIWHRSVVREMLKTSAHPYLVLPR